MQSFKSLVSTDYIDEGLIALLNRDLTAMTLMSGDTAPQNAEEGWCWNNVSQKKLYFSSNAQWKLLIDYSSGYLTRNQIEGRFQPLNQNLSTFGSPRITTQCFVSNGIVKTFTDYFKNTLMQTTNLYNTLGLKGLSKKNSISINELENRSITQDKFVSSLITDAPFKSGDICTSFNKNGKNGFLKLATNLTCGNSTSGATYIGNSYKSLFETLWKNPNLPLYSTKGVQITKTTASADWDNSCRMRIPDSPSYFSNTPGTVLFESNSASGTYTLDIATSGYYYVQVVGGGGGSYAFSRNYSHWWNGCAAGGSGAAFVGTIYIPAGQYQVVVGEGGASNSSGDGTCRSTDGGTSSIGNLISCTGGTRGFGGARDLNNLNFFVGTGGTVILNTSASYVTTNINGNVGGGANAYKEAGLHFDGGASVYGGYGAGSWAATYSGNPAVGTAGNGYVKIQYQGPYLPQSSSSNANNINSYNFYTNVTFYIKI